MVQGDALFRLGPTQGLPCVHDDHSARSGGVGPNSVNIIPIGRLGGRAAIPQAREFVGDHGGNASAEGIDRYAILVADGEDDAVQHGQKPSQRVASAPLGTCARRGLLTAGCSGSRRRPPCTTRWRGGCTRCARGGGLRASRLHARGAWQPAGRCRGGEPVDAVPPQLPWFLFLSQCRVQWRGGFQAPECLS